MYVLFVKHVIVCISLIKDNGTFLSHIFLIFLYQGTADRKHALGFTPNPFQSYWTMDLVWFIWLMAFQISWVMQKQSL